jgi:hypothetical protein
MLTYLFTFATAPSVVATRRSPGVVEEAGEAYLD